MGYLADTSATLNFSDTQAVQDYIKKHGIIQFVKLYKKFKDFSQEDIHWGDEIELHLLHLDHQNKAPKLQLNNEYMFEALKSPLFELQPEYGAWMLETVPLEPYTSDGDPNVLLKNFQARRQTINSLCREGDILYSGTVFPMMKVGDFYVPKKGGKSVNSGESQNPKAEKNTSDGTTSTFKDELLNPHPRYSTTCENIKSRKGGKPCMLVPIYPDVNTTMEETAEEPYSGFIYMDDTLFGTGNTSMQFTLGTKNIDEARYLCDQYSAISSIMLPLSAASAIFKGKLSDTDIRWHLLEDAVDSRTPEEKDPQNPSYVPKPRWGTISRYISNSPQCKEEYNDVYFPLNEDIMDFTREVAKEEGVEIDEQMIRHLGVLFAQDSLVVYADKIFVDDSQTTNHFENIQSTNWNNVRFKPPPSFDSKVGWRVELRTVEAQLTPEESVAYSMFGFFVGMMITKKHYNFYIPISKVDENVQRAHKRDALLTEKFWFRKNVETNSPDEWIELTVDEILHGKKDTFVGLFNLVFDFIKEEYGVDIQEEWKKKKEDDKLEVKPIVENMKYFELLSKRAKGEIPTIAHWVRSFVLKHPKYQKDSIVTTEIAYDLICAITEISDGKKTYQDFQ